MPMATKIPTHKSIVARFIIACLEHKCGEYKIHGEDHQRGGYDRSGRSGRNTCSGGFGIITFKYGNQGHSHTKENTFNHAIEDILVEIYGILHLRPIGSFVEANHDHANI